MREDYIDDATFALVARWAVRSAALLAWSWRRPPRPPACDATCGLIRRSSPHGERAPGGPIVIGMSLPLSGPGGRPRQARHGGLPVLGRRAQRERRVARPPGRAEGARRQFDQQTAISDYNRLISQDKVDLVLGTFSSDLNRRGRPVAERFKYAYVEPSGGADEIFERNFHYLFFAQPATTQRLPNRFVDLIEAMPRQIVRRHLALVQMDDPNTTQAADLFEERLGELGVKTVYDETYAPDTRTSTPSPTPSSRPSPTW